MANRLPIVGSDNNAWGTILDAFLAVSLNSDGTLIPAAIRLAAPQAAPVNIKPANPSAVTSTSLVMMGFGSTVTYTPKSTGNVLITVTGTTGTATAVANLGLGGRYGTGTAPVYNAAASGTRFGSATDFTFNAGGVGDGEGFSLTDLLALTAGTAYWFDIALSTTNASDAAGVLNMSFSIMETG